MADFCRQCTDEILGLDPDLNDMRDLTTEQDTAEGMGSAVLCEGCGPILVDHTGKCLGCEKHPDATGSDYDEATRDRLAHPRGF